MSPLSEAQQRFLEALERHLGVWGPALQETGTTRAMARKWLSSKRFRQAVEATREQALDLAEQELLKLIREGDKQAVLFYLKTQGQARGYTEKALPPDADEPTPPLHIIITEADPRG